jgi:PAS domain S-box-containing protein
MNNDPVKVLLVDDDEDDYILTRDWFEEIPGAPFELEWVDSYQGGLEAIASRQHDIYLLDYRLGALNGLELLREAVAQGCPGPIILLTGQGDHEVDVEAMKAGAADYLDKSQLGAALLERSLRYAMERHQTQQKIRQQAALLDITTDAILVRDRVNQIIFWNKGAERLYGWSAAEAIGKNASHLLYPEISSQWETALNTVFEKGEWQGELSQVTKNGKNLIVESRWTIVGDNTQQPTSILIVNTDITEKKTTRSPISSRPAPGEHRHPS